MKNNNEKIEEKLLDIIKQKEQADKILLIMEIVIGVLSITILLLVTLVVSFVEMEEWTKNVLIIAGFIPFIIGILFALKIEQVAGYYECKKCNHKYVPTYSNVLWAMHVCRIRYMKCPRCNKRSWQKKVLSK